MPKPDHKHSFFQRERASFAAAFSGLWQAFRAEPHLRFHLISALLVLPIACYLQCSTLEMVALVIVCGLVLVAEMINTAIERVVDLASPEWHDLARQAKDISAAAVLMGSMTAVCVGLLVFGPRIIEWLN